MFIEDRINAIKHYEEVLKLDTQKEKDDNFCFALGMAYKENLNFDKASIFIKNIDLNTNIKIHYNKRQHSFSSTELKSRIEKSHD